MMKKSIKKLVENPRSAAWGRLLSVLLIVALLLPLVALALHGAALLLEASTGISVENVVPELAKDAVRLAVNWNSRSPVIAVNWTSRCGTWPPK
jgi:Na+/proline symporter